MNTFSFGAQRVAMRQCHSDGTCADAMYLHGDHLGSVSLVTDSTGNVVSQARYTPYGELRWPAVSQSPTDFGYTGQRADSFGLMNYNARFYSPHLGRFVSADTVVPNPGKAVSFDRFAYGDANPIKYRDPSGHLSCDDPNVAEGDCSEKTWKTLPGLIAAFGVTISDGFTLGEMWAILQALLAVGEAFSPFIDGTTAQEAFKAVYGSVNITKGLQGASGGCTTITTGGCTSSSHQINFARLSANFLNARNNVIHELGHAFEKLWAGQTYDDPENVFDESNPSSDNPALVLGCAQVSMEVCRSMYVHDYPNRPDFPNPLPYKGWTGPNYGFASRQNQLTWQVSVDQAGALSEEFADQFLGWTFNSWENSGDGVKRSNFMNQYMPGWINYLAGH